MNDAHWQDSDWPLEEPPHGEGFDWVYLWNGWTRLYYGWPYEGLPYYCVDRVAPRFARQGTTVYRMRSDRSPELAGVIIESPEEIEVLDPLLRQAGAPVALWVRGMAFTRLTKLQNVDRVGAIALMDAAHIADLSPLMRFGALTSLYFLDVSANDLSPLATLGELRALTIHDCPCISDLSPVSELNRLEALAVQRIPKAAWSSIGNLRSLRAFSTIGHVAVDLLAGIVDRCESLARLSCPEASSLHDLQFLTRARALRSLDLQSTGVQDLSPLSVLSELRHLDIRGCDASDISPLVRLPNLHSLQLGSVLNDIAPLEHMGRLTQLGLPSGVTTDQLRRVCNACPELTDLAVRGAPELDDVAPVTRLRKLDTLVLTDCDAVDDLSPIKELKGLTSLRINLGRPVLPPLTQREREQTRRRTDVSFLESLKRLRRLSLSAADSLVDLSPLEDLTELVDLSLISGVRDLSFVKRLDRLLSLSVSPDSRVQDVSSLGSLSRLAFVDISGSPIQELWQPPADSQILAVHAGKTRIVSLDAFADVATLRSLDVSGAGELRDITAISSMPSLLSLDVSDCKAIRDFRPIGGCARLGWLNVSQCEVHLSDIVEANGLVSLRLDGCSTVRDLRQLVLLRGIQRLGLNDCNRITDLGPLSRMEKIAALGLGGTTHVRGYSPLGEVRGLVLLALDESHIDDLSFVSRLEKLRRVSVTACDKLHDLSPLSARILEGCRVTVSEPLGNQLHSLEAIRPR